MNGATVEEAIDFALDVFIDTVTDGAELHQAYNNIAVNVLDFAGATPVDSLDPDAAILDDGTLLTLRPDWSLTPARLRLVHMLGFKTRVRDLPNNIETIETVRGSRLLCWPMMDRTVLCGYGDYEPVLTRADGTLLYSPHDALNTDGTLLVTPSISLGYRTGRVTIEDVTFSIARRRRLR